MQMLETGRREQRLKNNPVGIQRRTMVGLHDLETL
jgi:hypothetical protein